MSAERAFYSDQATITRPGESVVVPSLEKPSNSQMSEVFAELPIAPGTNLECLASLIDGQNLDNVKEKARNNYLDMIRVSKELGIEYPKEINLITAVTLIDEPSHSAYMEEAKAEGFILTVAHHEAGHTLMAYMQGWKNGSTTVIPGPGSLGMSENYPPSGLSTYDLLMQNGKICVAGAISAEMMGDPVRGHGSDFAKAAAFAGIIENMYGIPKESSFSTMMSEAHAGLSGYGKPTIEAFSQKLRHRRTLA